MIRSMKAVAMFVAAGCLLAATTAQAQNKDCQSFRAVLQAKLEVSSSGPSWSGQVRGLLGDKEPLFGTLTYLSLSPSQTGQAGKESDLRWKLDFGLNGVMVTESDRGVFPLKPKVSDPFAFGGYMATARVVPDPLLSTGRFESATGNFVLNGVFVVDLKSLMISQWADSSDIGAWNAEISGKLCNVGQKP